MVMHAIRAFLAPTFISTVLTLSVSGVVFAQSGEQAEFGRKATIVHKIQNANERMEMTVATSRILTLDLKIPQAQVNDPNILDLIPLSPTEIQISAKNPGITEVNLWDENKQVYTIDVIVYADARELQMILDQQFPGGTLTVKAIGTRVLISGYVDNPDNIDTILRIAEAYYPDQNSVLTNIQVGGVHQVLLHVKLMEVSRTKLQALGFDWTQVSGAGLINVVGSGATATQGINFTITSGANTFTGLLEAMRNDSLAKILAEPTLVTVSGRAAYFEVGGEIGYQESVDNNGKITIGWKDYGTRLDFLPIVLGNGRIRLEVRPRVSELDNANAFGTIPAIKKSEVETGVEMEPGQTLAIAGLLQTRIESERRGIPWVSEVPYFGAMFRRVEQKVNEVELLIMVTPELVEPIDSEDVPRLGPGLQTGCPNDWQLYMRGHIEVPICCQSCGGTGCDQCAGHAADERLLLEESAMIGGSNRQLHGAETFYSSEQIDRSRTSGTRRAHKMAVPITSSPYTLDVSNLSSPAKPHNRSSQGTPSATPEPDSSSQLPGFMGSIGYDVVD
jgi:pilus assembly protein CpaC